MFRVPPQAAARALRKAIQGVLPADFRLKRPPAPSPQDVWEGSEIAREKIISKLLPAEDLRYTRSHVEPAQEWLPLDESVLRDIQTRKAQRFNERTGYPDFEEVHHLDGIYEPGSYPYTQPTTYEDRFPVLGSFTDAPQDVLDRYNDARVQGFPGLFRANNNSFHDYDSRFYATPERSFPEDDFYHPGPGALRSIGLPPGADIAQALLNAIKKERKNFRTYTTYGADRGD